MASDADFLTTHKNGVVAINANTAALTTQISSQSTQTNYYAGNYTSAALTAQTLVSAGSGYIVNMAVVITSTTAGTLNNAATVGAAAAANAIVATPVTVGVYPVGARFTSGLVVSPGTGQTIVVTYSLD